MNKERKPFITLGKSRFSKIANGLVLVVIIGFVLVKSGWISSSVSAGYEYPLSAQELKVRSQEELVTKLQEFLIDEARLSKELEKHEMSLQQFKDSVSIKFIFDTDQNGFQGLVVEFRSSQPADNLKTVFAFIANEVKAHVTRTEG